MVQSSAQVCCGSSVCRWSLRRVAASVSLHAMSWSGAETKVGHLSPWETCKAFAFYTALEAISKQLGQPAYALLGQRAPAWIAEQLTRKGGGCPSERAVLAAVSKCQGPQAWSVHINSGDPRGIRRGSEGIRSPNRGSGLCRPYVLWGIRRPQSSII